MLQRKLRQMSSRDRLKAGWTLFVLGLGALIIGIWFNHYSSFPSVETVAIPTAEAIDLQAGDQIVFERETHFIDSTPIVDPALPQTTVDLRIEVDYFGWVPRDCLISGGNWCLPWSSLGHLAALAGSQLMLIGLALALILGQKMTWALAAFAAFLAMLELVLLLGTVPSEWLNLAQGPLNWTEQNEAFTIWAPLVLGNDVAISWSAIKDFISINYNMGALTFIILFALLVQKLSKPAEDEAPPQPVSPYGRPLIKGAS